MMTNRDAVLKHDVLEIIYCFFKLNFDNFYFILFSG